jgi:hypothetical protein
MTQVIITDILVKFIIGFIVALGVWQTRKVDVTTSQFTKI